MDVDKLRGLKSELDMAAFDAKLFGNLYQFAVAALLGKNVAVEHNACVLSAFSGR